MKLDELLTLKALQLKQNISGISGPLAEEFIENHPRVHNVCCKISDRLFQDLDHVCSVLDMSKREFIEAAIIEAVKKAEAQLDALELPEVR